VSDSAYVETGVALGRAGNIDATLWAIPELYVLVTSSKERHNLRQRKRANGHILSAGSRQQGNVREMILSGNIFGKRKDYLATSSIWRLADVLMLTPRLTGLNLCINGEATPPH
jgi:hypothetical protein